MAANSKTKVGGKVRKKRTEEAMKNAVEAVGDVGDDEETILSVREPRNDLMFQLRPSEEELLDWLT